MQLSGGLEKASQHLKLQTFAIKILSQTCEGASRYKLKKSLAGKMLLTEGRSHCEQQHLQIWWERYDRLH
uniref:Uncharacterized protein n=2 Tax=Noccaea caerulescens TaxID=107243 RepID=A0A1J3IPW9_NOCCA